MMIWDALKQLLVMLGLLQLSEKEKWQLSMDYALRKGGQ